MTMQKPQSDSFAKRFLTDGINARSVALAMIGLCGWVWTMHGQVQLNTAEGEEHTKRLDLYRDQISRRVSSEEYSRDLVHLDERFGQIQQQLNTIQQTLMEQRHQ